MLHDPVVRRYARALYSESTHEPRIGDDVDLVRESIDASRQLSLSLKSPVVSREKKLGVLVALFESRVHPVTMRFLRLVIQRKREDLLPAIVQTFHALRAQEEGVTTAHVQAAAPLQKSDTARLRAALEERTGQRVRLDVTCNPDLLGGLVIRMGDTVHDGSVRHHLARLRTHLGANV